VILFRSTVSQNFPSQSLILSNLSVLDTALLQASQVLKLERPEKYDLERLHEWLRDKDQGALFLHKPEEETWGKLNAPDAKTDTSDQVTLAVREDHFSRGTATALVYLYDVVWGRHRKVDLRNLAIHDHD
jgi:hypothetical protein